jgi:hypothetical protein
MEGSELHENTTAMPCTFMCKPGNALFGLVHHVQDDKVVDPMIYICDEPVPFRLISSLKTPDSRPTKACPITP